MRSCCWCTGVPEPLSPVETERAEFTAALIGARVLVPTSVPGLWGRSAAFEDGALGVARLITALGSSAAADAGVDPPEVLRFPAVMPRTVLEKADYLASFPDLIGSIDSFEGSDAEHAALLAGLADGAPWAHGLAPTDMVLCSAACHPLYPTLPSTIPAAGLRADVLGLCFRHEPSADPARMQCFRQHEQVFIGSATDALAHRDAWITRALSLLGSLGLEVTTEVANDPFFGRSGRLLAAGQRAQALKIELVATVSSTTAPTAIASSNLHRDHFGRAFSLSLDGEPAHTACVGFGLERITLGLFRAHGLAVSAWPAAVRNALAL